MSNAIAFFPWLTCKEAIEAGPVRLLPYQHGKAPGNLPNVTQADMDGVIKAYSRYPGARTKVATILEVGDWQAGMNVQQEQLERLFDARLMIGFAALSERRLFRHGDYCNYDTYELVVQRFKPGETGTFAFSTRRRDGGTSHVWGSDAFAFHRPQHVDAHAILSVDTTLLGALMQLPAAMSRVKEALLEFNAANTDALGVPEHVEMVMTKSAFEWLLGIDQDAASFQRALSAAFHSIPGIPGKPGPMAERWASRWKNVRPLEAWARDFSVVRGAAAHGLKRGADGASVWPAPQHLAFASLLFPLLVKKLLADHQLMQLDHKDIEQIKRLDAYLMHDPFAPVDQDIEDGKHPWLAIDMEAFIAAVAPTFYPSMK